MRGIVDFLKTFGIQAAAVVGPMALSSVIVFKGGAPSPTEVALDAPLAEQVTLPGTTLGAAVNADGSQLNAGIFKKANLPASTSPSGDSGDRTEAPSSMASQQTPPIFANGVPPVPVVASVPSVASVGQGRFDFRSDFPSERATSAQSNLEPIPVVDLSRRLASEETLSTPVSEDSFGFSNPSSTVTSPTGPTQIALTGSAAINVNTCTPYTVTTQDSSAVATAVLAATTITFGGAGATGAFYSDAACTAAATTVTLAIGASSALVYYENTATTSVTLTADGSGFTQSSLAVNISDGPVLTFANVTVPMGTARTGIPFTVDEGGGGDDARTITMSVQSSSNPALVPVANVTLNYVDNGAADSLLLSPTIDITPVAGQKGSATITIRATDNMLAYSEQDLVVRVEDIPSANMALWFAGDAGITKDSSNLVSVWADQSGNGKNATQAGAARPTWTSAGLGGQNSLTFDGVDDTMTAANVSLSRNFTIFAVFRNTVNARMIYEHNYGVGNILEFLMVGAPAIVANDAGGSTSYTSHSNAWGNAGHVAVTTHISDGTHANHALYYNGGNLGLTENNTANIAGVATGPFKLGYRTSAGTYMSGSFAELIAYDTTLTGAQREQVENYLLERYGLNGNPRISKITNQTTLQDIPIRNIPFTVDEGGGATEDAQQITSITATSSNTTLVPNANIAFSTTLNEGAANAGATTHYMNITPASGETGTSVITLTTSDSAGGSSVHKFQVTVSAPVAGSAAPTAFTGLLTWLKADAGLGLDSNGQVFLWSDQSGNGNNASQATMTSRPTYTASSINSKPALTFDGGDLLRTGNINYSHYTKILVFSSNQQNRYITYHTAAGWFDYLSTYTTATAMAYAGVANQSALIYGGPGFAWTTSGAPLLFSATMGGTHASHRLFNSGALTSPTATQTTDPGSAAVNGPVDIGGRNGVSYLDGRLAEVIIFNRALSIGEREPIEKYLADKYGISYTGFRPNQLSSNRLWLDAAAGVTVDGSNRVTAWTDQSGAGNNAVLPVDANKPTQVTNVVNSLPVIRFATDDYVDLPNSFTAFTAGEMFAVMKALADPQASATADGLWAFGSAAGGALRYASAVTGIIIDAFGSTSRKTNHDVTWTSLANWHVYNAQSQANYWVNRINGRQHYATNSNTVGWTTTPRIGNRPGGTEYFNGDIAEFIVFNAALSAEDRAGMEYYLEQKYGIAPANAHSFLTWMNEDTTATVKLGYTSTTGEIATSCAVSNAVGGTLGACACVAGECSVSFTPTANLSGTGQASFDYTVTTPSGTTATQTVSVSILNVNDAPTVASTPSNRVYPLDGTDEPLVQGSTGTFTPTFNDIDGDSLTYSCTVRSVGKDASDAGYVAAGTNCRSLNSIVSVGGVTQTGTATLSANTLTWTPTYNQVGTYRFDLTATDPSSASATSTWYVTVRPAFGATNLAAALDAEVSIDDAALTGLASGARNTALGNNAITTAWLGLINAVDGLFTGFFSTVSPWSGSGTASAPYNLSFNGTNDAISLGTTLSTATRIGILGWLKPDNVGAASRGSVVLGNGGFSVQMSNEADGHLEFAVGRVVDYVEVMARDAPVQYWKLDEAAGTAASNSVGGGATLNDIVGTPARATPGALLNDSRTSYAFDGTNGMNTTGSLFTDYVHQTGVFSISLWVKLTDYTAGTNHGLLSTSNSGINNGFYLAYNATNRRFVFMLGNTALTATVFNFNSPNNTVSDNGWHHLVITGDGTTARMYFDGAEVANQTALAAYPAGNAHWPCMSFAGTNTAACTDLANRLSGALDEVALFDYGLTAAQVKAQYEAGKNGNFAANPVVAALPVSYWRMDTAGRMQDLGRSDTFVPNSIWARPGYSGATSAADASTASQFWGAQNIRHSVDLGFDAKSEMSLSAWVKVDSTGGGTIVEKRIDSSAGQAWYSYRMYLGGVGGLKVCFDVQNDVHGGYPLWCTTNDIAANADVTLSPWVHVAVVWKRTSSAASGDAQIYFDGVSQALTHTANSYSNTFTIREDSGRLLMGTRADKWYLDEIALFDYALSASQVNALRTAPDFWKCVSSEKLTTTDWTHFAALWDGTNVDLYINGRRDCRVSPVGATLTPTTNLVAGATASGAHHWSGSIAQMRLYGDTASAVLSAQQILDDYSSTVSRFRSTQTGTIATSGLVMHYDAANNVGGKSAESANVNRKDWVNLVDPDDRAVAASYSAVAADIGWQASPPSFAVKVSETNSLYSAASAPASLSATAVSLEAWVKATTLQTWGMIASSVSDGTWSDGFGLGLNNNTGRPYFFAGLYTNGAYGATALTTNRWYHIAGTFDKPNGTIYINGVVDGTVNYNSDITYPSSADTHFFSIGSTPQGSHHWDGNISTVRVYNRGLTANEVKQNYLAQAHRYLNQDVASIAGMIAWYKADAGTNTTTNGAIVNAWSDQSASANHLTAGGTSEPTYIANCINGRPCLRFGGNHNMDSTNNMGLTGDAALTVVAVINPLPTASWRLFGIGASTTTATLIGYRINSSLDRNVTYDAATMGGFGTTTSRPMILTLTKAVGAVNTSVSLRENGVALATPATPTVTLNITDSKLRLGGYPDSTIQRFGGDVAEFMIFNQALSASDRATIETYLASKYGIALP